MNVVATVNGLTGEILDGDAVEIGELYQRSNSSLVDAVTLRLECGHRLAVKKAEMAHGEWLPWLEKNAGVQGFPSPRSAQMLFRATRNTKSTSHLDVQEAIQLSRQMWGHSQDNHRAQGTGENEWYTPDEYPLSETSETSETSVICAT